MEKLRGTVSEMAKDSLPKLDSESLLSQANALMKLKRYKQMQTLKKAPIARESTALNSWVRQQGNAHTTAIFGTSSKASEARSPNDRLRLPKLDRAFDSASSNESLKAAQRAKKKRVTDPASCKTPNPCNQFYAKCIDDVLKCNEPKKMKLVMPRELRYVKNLPFLKYTAFGCGKSIDCLWQIETRPNASINLV